MSDLFDISIFETNLIVYQIKNIEKQNVYNSIPSFISQNNDWLILSKYDLDIRLDLMPERTSIGRNHKTFSSLILSRSIPDEIRIPIPEPLTAIKRPNIYCPPLPLSDEEDDEPVQITPFNQCLNRALNTFNSFIKAYIINYNPQN